MRALFVLLLVFVLPQNAFSEGTKGVAFVEAVEQNSGMCFGSNPDAAFNCARKKCMSNGTEKSDCLRVKWCYPSGWSADIFMQHREGNHWHQYLCGWNSRIEVEKVVNLICDKKQNPWLIECSMVQMWDESGQTKF